MNTKTAVRPIQAPRRSCVGCGTVTAKRSLIRVVRTQTGEVLPDPTGKKPGRGAYICADRRCWEAALKKGRLERSLKATLTAEEIDALRSHAAGLSLGKAG